jgi:hypothetical protein
MAGFQLTLYGRFWVTPEGHLEEPCWLPCYEAYQREANAQAGTGPKRYLEMRVKLQIAVCGTRVGC